MYFPRRMRTLRLQQQICYHRCDLRTVYHLFCQRTAGSLNLQIAKEANINIVGFLYRMHLLYDFLTFHTKLLCQSAVKNICKDKKCFRVFQISDRITDNKKSCGIRGEWRCDNGIDVQAAVQCIFIWIGYFKISYIRQNDRRCISDRFYPTWDWLCIFQTV